MVSLDSDRSHMVELSLDGYEDETIQLKKSTSGWLAGNILLGGIPGLIVDAATGGMYVLEPTQVNASLDEPTAEASTDVSIRVEMDVDTNDKIKIGELDPIGQ